MSDHPDLIDAQPYEARQCPECHIWIYTAAGPFAEGDPTKTEADWLHWEAEHLTDADPSASVFGFPFFQYNEEPVEAVNEHRGTPEQHAEHLSAVAQRAAESVNELMQLVGSQLSMTEAAAFGRVIGVAVRSGASEQEILR